MKTKNLLNTKKAILSLAAAASLTCGYGQVYPTVTWAKDQGASGTEVTYGITTDAAGNVYTTGLFLGTMDLDPGPGTVTVTALGQQDVFITKLDPNGNFVWGKTVGGTQGDVPANITVDGSSNVIVCGNFAGTADFDPGAGTFNLTSAGAGDGFLFKLDANGNFVWATSIGSSSNEFVNGVSTDASGNVYAAGLFTGTIDFDPGPGTNNMTSAGGDDGFVTKYTPSGALTWVRQMGTTGADAFNAIDVNSSGLVCVAGYFGGTLPAAFFNSFSSAVPCLGLKDGVLWMLTSAGVAVHGAAIASATEELLTAVTIDEAHNAIYWAGNYTGTLGAPWNLTNSGGTDVFFTRARLTGNLISGYDFTYGFGNAQAQTAKSLDVDPSGNVYMGGTINGTSIVDFDPRPFTHFVTGAGLDDAFAASYDSTGVIRFAFPIGNSNTDFAANSIKARNYDFFVGGGFSGTVDFDPGSGTNNMTSVATYDGYAVKYNFCAAPAMPTASTPTANLTVCSGKSATISASGVPGGNISWYTASIGGTYLGSGSSFVTQTLSTNTTFYAQDSTCTASNNRASITVTVIPSPTVTISSSPSIPVSCGGASITLAAFGASTYTWTGGVVNYTPFIPTGNTTYTVTGADPNGCTGTAMVSVTVAPSPTVTVNSGTICSGTSFTMVPSGASTYTIQGGSAVVSPTITNSYTVIGASANGCTGTATSNITVNTLPTVAVNSGSLCAGKSFTIVPTGAVTYTIQGGSAIVSPTANASYTVAGTGANGCTKTATSNITVNASPIISAFSGGDIISTVVGTGVSGYSGDGGPATAARLTLPTGVAFDAAGNMYVTDPNNANIRKINTSGVITTIAGGGSTYGDGGPATSAQLNYPAFITLDASGNIYFVDANDAVVRKINTSGIISTIAGSVGTTGYTGDGGPATSATFNAPWGIAIDAAGNLYIADYSNAVVRKVNTSGIISTIAGTGVLGNTGDGGLATAATLSGPNGVSVDAAGNIYIADYDNHNVRKINTSGIISTIAGTGILGFSGDGGLATSAQLNNVSSARPDAAGNVYIADLGNNRIRKINTSGIISTIAGNGSTGYTGDGGLAIAAGISGPQDVVIDAPGNVYITDGYHKVVRKVTPSLAISNPSVCAGNSVTLNASGANTYTWSTSATTSSISVTPSTTAIYTVNGTNAGGCSNSTTIAITVNAPSVNAVTSSSLICTLPIQQTATLTASGASTYTWNTSATTNVIAVSPSVTTSYTVTGTDANGCKNSTVITQSVSACTGVNNVSGELNGIEVYPNPNNGLFFVQVSSDVQIEVIDVLGKSILNQKVESGKYELNISDYANGVYFVKVKSSDASKTIKIVKQ